MIGFFAGSHIGSKSQIWDKRLGKRYNFLYNFCLQMYQKTKGTNEKVDPQEFISALGKNTFSSFNPSKIGTTPNFRGFHGFFKHV